MCPDNTRQADTVCEYPGCSRKVWKDPDGSFSSYCGKTHRDEMARLRSGSAQLCQNCRGRPVYVENGKSHQFCGIRCAKAFKAAPPAAVNQASSQDAGDRCSLVGCTKRVFVDRQGRPSAFCSRAHRYEAVSSGQIEPCLQCGVWPRNEVSGRRSDFCSAKCGRKVLDSAPAILEVDHDQSTFLNVSSQFEEQWKHSVAVPTIVKIWTIFSKRDLRDKFEQYKLSVERRMQEVGGNSRRRWHGTVRSCRLGDEEDCTALCLAQSCSLCLIIESSFQLAMAGQRTNFGRFGEGIYTSATSSKANDYVAEFGQSPYKAMLLNEVVMGKTIKMTTNDPTLTQPPAGYDSVVGEPGGDLNYDESIVYNNDAIRPLFLVIYNPGDTRSLVPAVHRNPSIIL